MESRTIALKDCPVLSVTVYRDRAEVVRTVPFHAQSQGEHELKISDLSQSMDPESIRVKGLGSCQILEVSHELVLVDDSKITNEPLKELKKKISDLEKKQVTISQQINRLKEQQSHISKYTENILYGNGAQAVVVGAAPGAAMARLTVTEATDILSFNLTQMGTLDQRINDLNEELNRNVEEIAISRIDKTKCYKDAKNGVNSSYTVSVLVAVNNGVGDITAQLTYVVSNTTWAPSYDVRVSTSTNEMDVTYYADVTQSTGEDWMDCEMFLSTSNPSIGAAPPPLPTRRVDWSYNNYARRSNGKNASIAHRKMLKKSRGGRGSDSDEDNDMLERRGSFSLIDGSSAPYNQMQAITNILPSAPPLPNSMNASEALTSGVAGSGEAGATTFTIHRKVNIASDSKPHKVTVTRESFPPQMVHYVSPNVDASAYQQAKVVNTSKFPLLASDKVSVFMDGNFISTSTMKLVSPGESFNIFLGVDPALKVEYRPCQTSAKTKGWMGSTEVKNYEYCTVLRNTKQCACRVIVAEILPRSGDEKIAVELLDPPPAALSKLGDGKSVSMDQDIISGLDAMVPEGADVTTAGASAHTWPADFVTQNKVTNNIVWLKTIPAGEKATFNFNYRVLWPQGISVDIF